MGRDQVRIVIVSHRIELVAACRLDTDKHLAEAQTGNHEAALAQHWIGLRRPPAGNDGSAVGLR